MKIEEWSFGRCFRFEKPIEIQNHHTSLQKASLNLGKKLLNPSEKYNIFGKMIFLSLLFQHFSALTNRPFRCI